MSDIERSSSTRFSFVSFLTGAAIGSGIALLTARRTGHDTRETLKGAFTDAGTKAREYIEKGKEFAADLSRKIPVTGREESHVH